MGSMENRALDYAVEITKSALLASTRDAGNFVIDKDEQTAQFLDTVYRKIRDLQSEAQN